MREWKNVIKCENALKHVYWISVYSCINELLSNLHVAGLGCLYYCLLSAVIKTFWRVCKCPRLLSNEY